MPITCCGDPPGITRILISSRIGGGCSQRRNIPVKLTSEVSAWIAPRARTISAGTFAGYRS